MRLLVCFPALASAFYLPGVAPRDYLPGEKVELKVNKLTSTKTQCAAVPQISATACSTPMTPALTAA